MRYITLFLFLCIPLLSICQQKKPLEIQITQEFQDTKKTDSLHAIKTIASGLTGLIRSGKKAISYDIFDENLIRNGWNAIEYKKKEKYLGELTYEDGIKVFTEAVPEKDERVLYCHSINLETRKFETVELSRIKIDKKLSLFSNAKGAGFITSPDASLYGILTYTIHRDKIFYIVSIFNAEDNSLVSENSFTRNESSWYLFKEVYLTDSGALYLLEESFYNEEAKIIKQTENRRFVLSRFSGKEYKTVSIDNDNNFLNSAKIKIRNGSVDVIGLYSIDNISEIIGTCYITFDAETLGIAREEYYPFPREIFEDLLPAHKLEGDNKDLILRDFIINQILTDKDDNIYLVAEETYYTDRSLFAETLIPVHNRISYWDFGKLPKNGSKSIRSNNRIVPHYDNLIILKYNTNNELLWGRSILKQDKKPGYNVFLANEGIHVLLNSGKNLKEFNDGRIKVSKGFFEGSSLYDYYFSKNGTPSINKIQDNSKESYYLPHYGTYVNERFIMMSDSKKNRKFMILSE